LQYYAFDGARSFAMYDDALFEAVALLKYQQVSQLGNWFAGKLAEVARIQTAQWRADVVVPVPLHAERRRERGYNQAELIARPLARALHLRLESRLLVRVKPRPPQLVLSRTERWQAVRGAYATREATQAENLRILLIDDVMTTGATLNACARVLKKAGAAAVFALTVGRARSGNIVTGMKVSPAPRREK
jgi:ComF family protein